MPTVRFNSGAAIEEVRHAALASMQEMGCDVVTQEPTVMEGKTPMSLRSWGGRLRVQLHPSSTGTIILAETEATGQLFDWGKSNETLDEFVARLSRVLDGMS